MCRDTPSGVRSLHAWMSTTLTCSLRSFGLPSTKRKRPTMYWMDAEVQEILNLLILSSLRDESLRSRWRDQGNLFRIPFVVVLWLLRQCSVSDGSQAYQIWMYLKLSSFSWEHHARRSPAIEMKSAHKSFIIAYVLHHRKSF
jgi:hypothetical protein